MEQFLNSTQNSKIYYNVIYKVTNFSQKKNSEGNFRRKVLKSEKIFKSILHIILEVSVELL
jgi:hypothetical protein